MLYSRVLNADSGLPPLVLIHGLFGSLENLGGLAKALTSAFTVYSVDLPNHGRSSHLSDGTLSKMASLLKEWMDEQGCLGTASLLGHSLGGKVAMELALSSPSRVTALAVLDIAPVEYARRHDDVFDGLRAIDTRVLSSRSEADAVLRNYVDALPVRTFLLKNLVKGGVGFTWRMNLDDLYQSYSGLIGANCEGVFKGKTVFIKGGDSNYIREEYREAILTRFPAAQLKIVSGTGHWLHAEKPDLVSKIVIKALI